MDMKHDEYRKANASHTVHEHCQEARVADVNDWLHLLPVNSHGRHMLTLEKARQLALLNPTSWCICPYRCGYGIGKQTAFPRCDLYYIVDKSNEPLCFDDLDAAINFLHTQLHIQSTYVLLNAAFQKPSFPNSRCVPIA